MKLYIIHCMGFSLAFMLFVSGISGCKKNVTVDPPVSATTLESIFKEDATAIAVLTGLYSRISANSFNMVSKRLGLSSDEFSLWEGANTNDLAYYKNSLQATIQPGGAGNAGHELWNDCYWYISTCNSAIEGLNKSSSLTHRVKQQLMGEAKFMRAFLYFYLVNLYGDIPLVTTTDYEKNRLLARSSPSDVYKLIIADLKEAQDLLSNTFLNGQLINYSGTPERVRPTTWAASAFLSRVFLYMGDYSNAEIEATKVINNPSLFNLDSLANAFLANNNEAIWQLQPVNLDYGLKSNTEDGRIFILSASPEGLSSEKSVYLSSSLVASFENGDNRKMMWVGTYIDGTGTYYFPNKYKLGNGASAVTEYLMVLRLAEQYLIRAEARAKMNKINEAQADLNTIRSRAGLTSTISNDQTSVLTAILQERRVELFTEWGHRWLDLKRKANIDAVMTVQTPLKANGAPWQSYQQWYPLPIEDIQRDPNLVQTPGY